MSQDTEILSKVFQIQFFRGGRCKITAPTSSERSCQNLRIYHIRNHVTEPILSADGRFLSAYVVDSEVLRLIFRKLKRD